MCNNIKKMFLSNTNLTITEIAREMGVSKVAVFKVLKDVPEYQEKQKNKDIKIQKRNNVIKDLFIYNGMGVSDIVKSKIGKELKLTTRIVHKVLNELPEYQQSQVDKREDSLSKQNMIKELYFDKKIKVKDIALRIGVAESFVTQVIQEEEQYNSEKERRKAFSKKNIIFKNQYDKDVWEGMKILQEQNAMEMSRKSKISDEALVFRCRAAYDSVYDGKRNELVYNYKCGQPPADMPLKFSLKAIV